MKWRNGSRPFLLWVLGHGFLIALGLLCVISPCMAASHHLEWAIQRIENMAKTNGVPFPLVSPEIRILKAAHRLELWSSGKCLKSFNVGLGHRGLAHKIRLGDHLTPEGTFYICTRNSRSMFHLFLGLSYPDVSAAQRGLQNRQISPKQFRQIVAAIRQKTCPPWNTPLGGTVGIHGGGSGSDWTWGCIALENPDIEELFVTCPLGTPVSILP